MIQTHQFAQALRAMLATREGRSVIAFALVKACSESDDPQPTRGTSDLIIDVVKSRYTSTGKFSFKLWDVYVPEGLL